jgi:D-serine deaminase-like pyridoxal phosphate-dependent protein
MTKYETLKDLFAASRLPLAYVDLDLLDRNIVEIIKAAKGMKIRIATKSLRCREILEYLIKGHPDAFNGFMCFHLEEANWLLDMGMDNILMAYPYYRSNEFEKLTNHIKMNKKISVMVDCIEHLEVLNQAAMDNYCKIPICLDLDLSIRFPFIYFGVFRSSLKSSKDVAKILMKLIEMKHLKLVGVMGYEAQIAGLTDNNPFQKLLNIPIRILKKLSIKKIHKRRQNIVKLCTDQGFELEYVNGGGTGSLDSTSKDYSCTEVTVGSGFYSPSLFDYYKSFKYQPAAAFALEVTRKPRKGIVTCAGGGYIASGATGMDKVPMPYLPLGTKLEPNEQCGEVQTPLHLNKAAPEIQIGDPIFFRHAKAGELCERFNELYLIKGETIQLKVKTYRGEGKCFL